MEMQIFSIYDEKAKTFNTPFFQHQIGQALRAFSDAVSDVKTTLHNHPEDFRLYHIGVYNDDTSLIESFNEPRVIASATDYKRNQE